MSHTFSQEQRDPPCLFLDGELTFMRPLLQQDLRPEYLDWLNNPALSTYSAHFRTWPTTQQELEAFLGRQKSDRHVVLAACCKETGEHFGNFSLDNIEWVSRTAESNGMIGLPKYRTAHYLDIMQTLAEYAFARLNLRKLCLGTEMAHLLPLLARLGWKEEGLLKQQNYRYGEYVDVFLMSLFREDHQPRPGGSGS